MIPPRDRTRGKTTARSPGASGASSGAEAISTPTSTNGNRWRRTVATRAEYEIASVVEVSAASSRRARIEDPDPSSAPPGF